MRWTLKQRGQAVYYSTTPRRDVPGIDLRDRQQLELIESFAALPKFPFASATTAHRYRYSTDNDWFGPDDAVMLYCVLSQFRPAHVVEVGSGFSSALMLDVDQHFLGASAKFTFIDPNPERLESLLNDSDKRRSRIIRQPVQSVDREVFDNLESGDLLFIDSSHNAGAGSDVNLLLLEVAPTLAPGVIIHLHDIFHSFEYPEHQIQDGTAGSEAYLLRALLISNPTLEVLLFNAHLTAFHRDAVHQMLPAWGSHPGGSIWLRRV
jgi:predicted O-methyltransferase YrrM